MPEKISFLPLTYLDISFTFLQSCYNLRQPWSTHECLKNNYRYVCTHAALCTSTKQYLPINTKVSDLQRRTRLDKNIYIFK